MRDRTTTCDDGFGGVTGTAGAGYAFVTGDDEPIPYGLGVSGTEYAHKAHEVNVPRVYYPWEKAQNREDDVYEEI
jgi:hypothetical protein